MHILGFIFIVFIIVFVIGISLIGSIIRALFGFKRRGNKHTNNTYNNTNQQQNQSKQEGYTHRNGASTFTIFDTNVKPRKKIFTQDEGDYVDYEVII